MAIKLIAVDLDGTLLNSNHEISDYNYCVIKEAERRGIAVVISTGRLYSSLYKYKEKLNLKTPVICYNGAKVVDGRDDSIIFERTIDEEVVKKVIKIAREKDVHLNLFQDEKWYVECRRDEVETYRNSSGLSYHLADFDKMEKLNVTKLMFVGENGILKEIEKIVKTELGNFVYTAFSKPYFFEILDSRVSKGEALKKIAEQYGIEREEVMAFGDGYNDIEMLQYAGVGVAMGNAPEEMKLMFENRADICDNDGVGKFIENYIFK